MQVTARIIFQTYMDSFCFLFLEWLIMLILGTAYLTVRVLLEGLVCYWLTNKNSEYDLATLKK